MIINGAGVLLAAIVLFGIFMSFQSFRTMVLGALKNIPPLPLAIKQRLDAMSTFVIWIFIAIMVVVIIRALVRAANCRDQANGGRTMFETFLGADEMPPQPTQMQQLTQQVVRAADRAAQNLDEIITLVDPTCSLVKLTEDAYANSQAALSESELALPASDQQRLQSERLTRARGQFARRRKLFGALQSGAPMLECFTSAATATADEATLLAAVKQLHQILENTESRAAILSAEQMRVALLFVQKSKDQELGTSDAATSGGAMLDSSMPPAVSPDALRGTALMAYANQLLVREHRINMQVSDLKQDISNLQQSIEAMKATAVRTMSGTPNMTDMRAGLTAIQAQQQQRP